jgi:YbbR domain-containing protein
MRWILSNWQIKLVALSLAVALWFYTSGQARIERTLNVVITPAAVRNLPEGARISGIEPHVFSVEIDGPMTVVQGLRPDAIAPRLEIVGGAIDQGRQDFPITNEVLGLPAEIRIQRVNPARDAITVTLGKVVETDMLVDPPRVVDVPGGLEPSLSLEEGRVVVTGPQDVISEMLRQHPRLRFLPVSLASANASIERAEPLRLRLVPDAPPSVEVPPVYARVTLKPVDGQRQQVGLAVHLLATPDFLAKHRVELSQPQVVVTVRGPRNLLAALTPESLAAYVNLRRPLELNQPQEVPVEVLGPAWLTADPVAVRVTVSLLVPRGGDATLRTREGAEVQPIPANTAPPAP